MKIDERKVSSHAVTPVSSPPAPRGAPTAASGGGRVDVSGAVDSVAGLRASVGALDVIRPERVSALRVALANGTYRPELPNVARSLLCDLLGELLA